MIPIFASIHIKTSTETLHDDISSSRLAENLLYGTLLIALNFHFTKILYIALFSLPLRAVSQNYLRCCLLGCSPYCAPNKT